MEDERVRREEYEGRDKSRIEEKPPPEWCDQIYIGKEEHDWAEIGPLPRGGKGKTNNQKRKRTEREGNEVSKRRGWVRGDEYLKIDSRYGVQPRVYDLKNNETTSEHEAPPKHGQRNKLSELSKLSEWSKLSKKSKVTWEQAPPPNCVTDNNGSNANSRMYDVLSGNQNEEKPRDHRPATYNTVEYERKKSVRSAACAA
eukprot:scaffold8672_cov40-Cyclotella_meneghiniana.AAC.2